MYHTIWGICTYMYTCAPSKQRILYSLRLFPSHIFVHIHECIVYSLLCVSLSLFAVSHIQQSKYRGYQDRYTHPFCTSPNTNCDVHFHLSSIYKIEPSLISTHTLQILRIDFWIFHFFPQNLRWLNTTIWNVNFDYRYCLRIDFKNVIIVKLNFRSTKDWPLKHCAYCSYLVFEWHAWMCRRMETLCLARRPYNLL